MPLGNVTAPWSSAGVPPGPVEQSGLTIGSGMLAGRSSAGTGPLEQITVGSGLTLAAGVLTANTDNFDGVVNTWADLPTAVPPATGALYLVRQNSGTWLINRHPAGLYQRVAQTGVRDTDWYYLGEWLEEFSDANFSLYNNADNTKALKFSLSGITSGQTRTLTVPDASGTILVNTLPVNVGANSITGGAGSFTTLSASGPGLVFNALTATTAAKFLQLSTTGGGYYLGIESNAGGFFTGANPNETVLYSPGNVVYIRTLGIRTEGSITGGAGSFTTLDATGTLNATTGTFTAPNGTVSIVSSTGTNRLSLSMVNTGGTYYWGVDNSTGSSFGGTAYASIRYAPSGRVIQDIINSTPITTVSATGLAVTGTLNQTGGSGSVWTYSGGGGGLELINSSDTSGTKFLAFDKSTGTTIGSISRVTTTDAVAFNTTSARELKDNIEDIRAWDNPMSVLNRIPIRVWDWHSFGRPGEPTKHDDLANCGVIYDEVFPVFPDACSPGKPGKDKYGAPIDPDSVDYSKFVPLTIAGLQDHDAEIKELRAQVVAINERLAALKAA